MRDSVKMNLVRLLGAGLLMTNEDILIDEDRLNGDIVVNRVMKSSGEINYIFRDSSGKRVAPVEGYFGDKALEAGSLKDFVKYVRGMER